jgi:hypothetical protein
LREVVRELVCRAGGLIPPVRTREGTTRTRTHQPRRKTPGINPGARGTSFLLARSAGWGLAATLLFVLSLGCEGRQSTTERVEKAYKSAGISPRAAYALGGKVTVDGQPPVAKAGRSRFLAAAYEAAKPDATANGNAHAFVQPDGSFELPPLPPGRYVMLFAQLDYDPKIGFIGRDGLENLYNDPDVNAKKPDFVIDHQAPGKKDYAFNLSVAGETPPAAPGAKAFVGSVRGPK